MPPTLIDDDKYKIYELVAFSAAALYFELAIIRFTASEVLYLGYFSNFILISSFVGLGLGFLAAGKKARYDQFLPFALLFLFALVLVSQFDVEILKNHFGLFFFGNLTGRAGLPGALLLGILFLATAMFFLCIGRRIALAFAKFMPLQAYTYDIAGSLFGIFIFSLQSFYATGPRTWVVTGGLLLVVAYLFAQDEDTHASAVYTSMATVCILILLSSAQTGYFTIWSAYQKLEVVRDKESPFVVVMANGIVHQIIQPVAHAHPYYSYPYRLMQDSGLSYDKVLIIGAGSGTDVAVAMEYGAREIDTVEIDSRILDIGKKFHPDKPYADSRVNLYVADGRQFLETTDKQYDLIIFALPDSLMRLSAMNSVRLESFLFTREAFNVVKQHLGDHGVFIMYNQYRWPWLVNKIAATLDESFAKPPLIYTEGPTTVFATGKDISGDTYSKDGFEGLPTDDWPFVYMQKPGVHWLYIGMIAVFMLVSVIGIRFFAPAGTLSRPDFPFFFMGMAFLLLETKSLAFFSLLFGTTWVVNSVAFSGILLSVLMANLMVQHTGIYKRTPLFVCLLLSLLAAYVLPPSLFLKIDSTLLRYGCGILIMFLPIFFANMIFSREFRDVEESTRAFGWNLLGAVAGGGLEYFSLVIGFRNLLWIVAVCYLCTAWATGIRFKNNRLVQAA
jgi:hypothetical protein